MWGRARPNSQGALAPGQALARVQPDALVFTTLRDKPQSRRNVLRAVHAAGDAAGLNGKGRERVGVHDLRHSFVAVALAAGLTLPEAAALARHANPRVTAACMRAYRCGACRAWRQAGRRVRRVAPGGFDARLLRAGIRELVLRAAAWLVGGSPLTRERPLSDSLEWWLRPCAVYCGWARPVEPKGCHERPVRGR